jgi:hypothetical protein
VAQQYRDRAPRRIKLANGKDALALEGKPLIYGGTSLFGGRAPEVFDPTILDYDNTPGCGPAEQRLREQDLDGIDAEVLFALDVRNSAIRDKAARIGVVQGFNDFFAEEYCAVDRDRLIGMAVMPNSGVAEDIAEMERCKRMGFKGPGSAHSQRQEFSDRRRRSLLGRGVRFRNAVGDSHRLPH